MDKKLLPIGTVVVLKETQGRTMISGYLAVNHKEPNKAYDYSGFAFPLGFNNNEEVFCFDHEQIDKIVQYGFRDYECDAFLTDVENHMDAIKKKVAEG